MKELSIEEKARAYDKAIEKAKSKIKNDKDHILYEDDIFDIFPKLKENENERIKNFINNELICLRAINEKGSDRYEELTNAIAWLEKQGQKLNKVSIWKHWKNGIAGNGDGNLIYLIKIGNTYNLSSCLSVECDYIELTELNNLNIIY